VLVQVEGEPTAHLTLFIKGTVQKGLRIEPPSIHFSRIGPMHTGEQTVSVCSSGHGPPLEVKEVTVDSGALDVVWKANEVAQSWIISVRPKPPLPLGLIEATVRVHTDNQLLGTIEIPVRAIVVGAIHVVPDRLVLPFRAPAQGATVRYLSVLPGAAGPIKRVLVEPPVTSWRVTVAHEGRGVHRIEIGNIVDTADLDGKVIRIIADGEGTMVPITVEPQREP